MRNLIHRLLLIILLIISGVSNGYAQYSPDSLSIDELVKNALDMKIEYTSSGIQLNTSRILENSKGFYVFSERGMYEQFNFNGTEATLLKPYKGHYPPPGFSLQLNGQMVKDSFNPHGVRNIESALLNGFINGILFGNKY